MPEKKKKSSGRPSARAVAKYTSYNVYEPAELMDFLYRRLQVSVAIK